MKLNLANPLTGLMKKVEVDDEKKVIPFYGEKIGAKVLGDSLGEEFKGYIFRIAGGNDKQGFPMMNGVLTDKRVKILFKKGMKCYRPRKDGERSRKSVRGCIVSSDLSLLNLTVYKKGETDIPGLTDALKPNRLGPKRAGRIRKHMGVAKNVDLRSLVVRRVFDAKDGKKAKTKAPKIQRLVTTQRIRRKKHLLSVKKERFEVARGKVAEYKEMMEKYNKELDIEKAAKAAKKKAVAAKAT